MIFKCFILFQYLLYICGAQAWVPAPQHKKKTYEHDETAHISIQCVGAFTLFSHFVHIVVMFLLHLGAWGPVMGPTSQMIFIFLVICFSYYFNIFVYPWTGGPVQSAIFENNGEVSLSIIPLLASARASSNEYG